MPQTRERRQNPAPPLSKTQEANSASTPNLTQEASSASTTNPTKQTVGTSTTIPTQQPLSTSTTNPTQLPNTTSATIPTQQPLSASTTNPTQQPDTTSATIPTQGTLTPTVSSAINSVQSAFIPNPINSVQSPSIPSSINSVPTSEAQATPPSVTATGLPVSTGANPPNESGTGEGRLKSGVVAGTVVGVAMGVALLTALVTFLIMRQIAKKRGRRDSQSQIEHVIPEQRYIGKQGGTTGGNQPLAKDVPIGYPALADFLPQPADDKTVQSRTKTILDQIELFVENFCQAQPNSQASISSTELSSFGSPSLQDPLSDLLIQAQDATPFIKHILASYIVTAISVDQSSEDTLLPTEFSLLLSSVMTNESHTTKKAGFSQCLSQWRVISAFLLPNPSSDSVYTSDRDRKITKMSQKVLSAFSAWMNTKYNEQDRIQSLGLILNEVAGLGTFLFSQPSDMRFQWPELSASRLAITPALVKITDEYGRKLARAQVLVNAKMK